MYHHYDELGTACGYTTLNVCGADTEVHYFHTHRDGVDLVFVSHPCFYEVAHNIYQGTTMDVTWRGALLSQAGIEAVYHVPCGGFPYGDESLLYVANDWHVALLPVYLRAFYHEHMKLGFARSALIVHNIAHQGRTTPDDVWRLGLPDHHTGAFYLDDPQEGACMNVLKAGIEYATKVIAVSPGYAWENRHGRRRLGFSAHRSRRQREGLRDRQRHRLPRVGPSARQVPAERRVPDLRPVY
jgi:starch synthase